MFMSTKLDRLVVGSILKQRIGLSNQCSIGANESSYPAIGRYISCWWNSPRIPSTDGRRMGIDNESDQVS